MKRVLIVSDSTPLLARLDKTLASMGYEVAGSAASVEEAIDRAAAARPDIILMDIDLPGQTENIRAGLLLDERIDIPVMFVADPDDDGTIDGAPDHGAGGWSPGALRTAELRAPSPTPEPRQAAETYTSTATYCGSATIT